jgi:hypothetical protein
MNPNNISLTVIAIIAALAIMMASTVIAPAFAIKRFYNCMTDVANKYGKLTIDDVNLCYDKEYHSGPYAAHSHSTSGVGGSSDGSGDSSK